MKLNHIYKSIACGVLLAMTATSCDLDYNPVDTDRKSTRLNSSHNRESRMPSSA